MIKDFINKWFEDRVAYDEEQEVYNNKDFWTAWDELEKDIDLGGIQWCFEWYMESPSLTETREKYIKSAIYNYIKFKIKPMYVNY